MLYYLSQFFVDYFSFFNVVKYITFRSILSFLTAFFIIFQLMPTYIQLLKKKMIGQQVRDDGPKTHFSKSGTPTMGGGLILFSIILPTILWADILNKYVWFVMIITVGYGLIGFMDDYLKVSKKNTKGLPGKLKLVCQFILAFVVCYFAFKESGEHGEISFPFLKDHILSLGVFYILFSMFVIVGASNAVNLTDGLDGLAIGPIITTAGTFVVLTYVTGHFVIADYLNYPYIRGSGELAIVASAMVGAGLGFLWYNTFPAQIFMGDVGSLPLGGALGIMAVLTKHEILLALIGGVFVAEALSVMLQVASFKLTKKRIFKMAPIHHHFELKGWPEPKVIVRFWIISIILAMIGLLSLKLR